MTWPTNWQSWTTYNPRAHVCYGCETPAPAGTVYRPRSTPWGPLLFCARCETGDRGPYWDSAAWHAEQDKIEGAA